MCVIHDKFEIVSPETHDKKNDVSGGICYLLSFTVFHFLWVFSVILPTDRSLGLLSDIMWQDLNRVFQSFRWVLCKPKTTKWRLGSSSILSEDWQGKFESFSKQEIINWRQIASDKRCRRQKNLENVRWVKIVCAYLGILHQLEFLSKKKKSRFIHGSSMSCS